MSDANLYTFCFRVFLAAQAQNMVALESKAGGPFRAGCSHDQESFGVEVAADQLVCQIDRQTCANVVC